MSGAIPPGLNSDGILGYIAATVTSIKSDLADLTQSVQAHERRINALEEVRRSEEQTKRQILSAGRFLAQLPPALIGALAGFFGGKAT